MPASVTVRDRFGASGLAGVSFRGTSIPRRLRPTPRLSPANPRRVGASGAPPCRVIHMLIMNLGRAESRYLPVTMPGGGWNPLGGGWKRSKKLPPAHFDLVEPQVNTTRRGMAGDSGGYFLPFTSEISIETTDRQKTHTFADPRFFFPANPRQARSTKNRSHDVTTRAGAR